MQALQRNPKFQGNFANVGKYIFYIINSVAALLLWTRNGTATKGAVAAAA